MTETQKMQYSRDIGHAKLAPEKIEDCHDQDDLLLYLFKELRFHNDGDSGDREFCENVGRIWGDVEDRYCRLAIGEVQ